ncbi:MAG: hypothetical protein Q4E88_02545 [Coriobacteriia bacterium]|nr:hypothetical protein [Coriobacteriia bacterium]
MPSIKNVKIDHLTVNGANIEGHGGKYAMQIRGFDKPCIAKFCEVGHEITDCYIKDFTFTNSKLLGSTQAFDLEYVDGLVFDNFEIHGSTKDDKIVNCKNFKFSNCDFRNSAIKHSTLDTVEFSTYNNCLFNN